MQEYCPNNPLITPREWPNIQEACMGICFGTDCTPARLCLPPHRARLPHRNTHRAAGAVVRRKGWCGIDYVTQVHTGRGRMRQETLKPALKLANSLTACGFTVNIYKVSICESFRRFLQHAGSCPEQNTPSTRQQSCH